MADVYVLKCEGNKYYVGKTNNCMRRITNHFRGGATAWTSLHKPTHVVEIFQNCDPFDEDKIAKKYMATYGIDNVRGGSYVKVKIDDYQKAFLKHEFITAQDRCYRCGELGHFIRDCSVPDQTSPTVLSGHIIQMMSCFLIGNLMGMYMLWR